MIEPTQDIAVLDSYVYFEDDGRFEFADGRAVEKSFMGAQANELALLLMSQLFVYVRANRLGRCFSEKCVYQIFVDEPKKTRIPDGSFIRAGRLPGDRAPSGHMTIPPDLAVEVVSPTDLVENLDERIADFLKAGVRLLWVVIPKTRQVDVHRADGAVARLTETDVLSGEDVVPGFECRLDELFASV